MQALGHLTAATTILKVSFSLSYLFCTLSSLSSAFHFLSLGCFFPRTCQRPSARFSKCRHAYKFAMKARLCAISVGIVRALHRLRILILPLPHLFLIVLIELSNERSNSHVSEGRRKWFNVGIWCTDSFYDLFYYQQFMSLLLGRRIQATLRRRAGKEWKVGRFSFPYSLSKCFYGIP